VAEESKFESSFARKLSFCWLCWKRWIVYSWGKSTSVRPVLLAWCSRRDAHRNSKWLQTRQEKGNYNVCWDVI